jgi:tetratricopeptide (TPR) repeat protein
MMKKMIGLGLLLLSFTLFFIAQEGKKTDIEWRTDYNEAIEEARIRAIPILIFFSASWSKPSQEMLEKVWSNDSVINYSKKFVNIHVDVDSNPELVKKYNIKSYPSVIFTDPWGHVTIQHVGVSAAKDIVMLMRGFPSDLSFINELKKKVEENTQDVDTLRKLAQFYSKIQVLDTASEYYQMALELKELEGNEELKDMIIFGLAWNEIRLKNYKKAEEILEEELKEYPKGKSTERLLYALFLAKIGLREITEAEKIYKKLKTKYPDSKHTELAARTLESMKKKIKQEKEKR